MTPSEKLEYLIDQYVVGKKAYRNRQILKLWLIDGYSYEDIAAKMEMSAVQVGRIIRRDGDKILLLYLKN